MSTEPAYALLATDAAAITRQFKLTMDRDYPWLAEPEHYVAKHSGNRHAARDDWNGDMAACTEDAILECKAISTISTACLNACDYPELFGELLDYITTEMSLDPPSLDPYRE